ncbi:hypothetical protein F0U63_47110 [Cystobacter fuscus]|nr:hypothetical protein F0U63_47110 [Cystobacter fuscus]
MNEKTKRKRIRRVEGAVVSIDLGDGTHGFGRVLERPLFAFYDLRGERIPPIEEIIAKPVLFKICVMDHAVTAGTWPVVGSSPLEPSMRESPFFFKQDGPGRFWRYRSGQETPASRSEIEGLERAAVWEPIHVVDRLKDHFAGRENIWVKSLMPQD